MATMLELITLAGTRPLTPEETAELMQHQRERVEADTALRKALKASGVALPNEDETKSGGKLIRDVHFLTHWEARYTEYKMAKAAETYNGYAHKYGLPWCTDPAQLPELVKGLPYGMHASAADKIADADTTYRRSWGEQIDSLAKLNRDRTAKVVKDKK